MSRLCLRRHLPLKSGAVRLKATTWATSSTVPANSTFTRRSKARGTEKSRSSCSATCGATRSIPSDCRLSIRLVQGRPVKRSSLRPSNTVRREKKKKLCPLCRRFKQLRTGVALSDLQFLFLFIRFYFTS